MTETPTTKPILLKQKRVSVPLSDEQFDDLHRLAYRNHVSIAHLGQIAIMLLLISDFEGKFSMVPEFMFDEEDMPRA